MPAYAGYRFVSIHPCIIPPPVPYDRLHLDEPIAAGSVSGVLSVGLTAKTPICRGEEEDGIVTPFRLGQHFALPGASLRGMVRSVFEIATFSHLGHINAHHRFGYRDFTREEWRERTHDVKAGWLWFDSTDEHWRIAPTDGPVRLIRFDALCGERGPVADLSPANWLGMTLADKRGLLAGARLNRKTLLDIHDFERLGQQAGSFERVRFRVSGGIIRGTLVCAGAAETVIDKGVDRTKRHEAVFGLCQDRRARTVPKSAMETFVRLNSNPGRDQPEPTGNWRYWLIETGLLGTLGYEARRDDPAPTGARQDRIPVFYVGDLDRLTEDDPEPHFAFGLSRVIKVPYRHSVGEVAARGYAPLQPQYKVPRLRESFDFTRAVFGEVDDTFAAASGSIEGAASDALKGRVAFGFAKSHDAKVMNPPRDAALLGPRASYFPFYLKGPGGGLGTYDEDTSIIAGRKRYPVRHRPHNLPPGAASVLSHIQFLEAGCTFEGRLRFHNLHPVELGAVLWALTFGCTDGSRWHSLGRCRGFGYGALSPQVAFIGTPHLVNTTVPATIEALMGEFTAYMTREVGEVFDESKSIRELVNMADPDFGDRHRDALAYADLDTYGRYKREGRTLPNEFQ